jgi:mannose-6-phosphate isomerase-like protein (cupin superfamily)
LSSTEPPDRIAERGATDSERRGAMGGDTKHRGINLAEKFALLREQWQPRVVAELNDYQVKIARVEGDFIWHDHPDTDEAFFVLEGTLRIDLPDGSVELAAGELFVVPRGVQHKPFAEAEAKVLLIEPRGVPNTGTTAGPRTAEENVWI